MNPSLDSQLDEILEQIGDIAHEKYTGCDMENGEWRYGYTDEVVNIVQDPRIKSALLALIEQEVTLAQIKAHEHLDSQIHELCSTDDDADIDKVLGIIKYSVDELEQLITQSKEK